MKVNINMVSAEEEEEVHLHIHTMNETITQAIQLLTSPDQTIKHLLGKQDGTFYKLDVDEVFYLESIDRRLFVYTGTQTYELADKLYVLEEQLAGLGFVRISKSMLLNLNKIHSFYPKLSGNLEAVLINQEKVSISRRYVPGLKKQLGMREA